MSIDTGIGAMLSPGLAKDYMPALQPLQNSTTNASKLNQQD